MSETIEVADGKYTIENDNGVVKIHRYGEFWKFGDKFDLSLFMS